jgi:hypothetical protein
MRFQLIAISAVLLSLASANAQDATTTCQTVMGTLTCHTAAQQAMPAQVTPDYAGSMARGVQLGAALGGGRSRGGTAVIGNPSARAELGKAIRRGDCKRAVLIALVEGNAEYAKEVEHYCPLLSDAAPKQP